MLETQAGIQHVGAPVQVEPEQSHPRVERPELDRTQHDGEVVLGRSQLGGNQHDQVKFSNFFLTSYEVRGYRWPV